MISNAVQSANRMDWRNGMAFSKELQVPMDHLSIYQLNNLASFGEHAANELREVIFESMDDTLEASKWKKGLQISEAKLEDIRLSKHERDVIIEGCKRVNSGNKETLLEIEKAFATEGYGVPAIAIVILILVVIVAVAAMDPTPQ
jgi:hypothetical protein